MNKDEYEFFISVDTACSQVLDEVIHSLRTQISGHVHELSRNKQKDTCEGVRSTSTHTHTHKCTGICSTTILKAQTSPYPDVSQTDKQTEGFVLVPLFFSCEEDLNPHEIKIGLLGFGVGGKVNRDPETTN